MRIYANAEAITAFERVAALLEAGMAGDAWQKKHWEIAAQVYKSLGDIFAITGRQPEARQAYQRAIAWLPSQEYIWQARLLRKTAGTWNLASCNPLDTFHAHARQTFQEAERLLEQAEVQASSSRLHQGRHRQNDRPLQFIDPGGGKRTSMG